MNYQETLDYLFTSTPLFQHVGKDAYKEGLDNTQALDEYFGHPHTRFRTIHVAGTNGKGSCSHTLAALLQSAGYKVGLYTSPHLTDFRERIRIDGKPVAQDFVTDFVERHRPFFEPLHPSFFELTTAMAFHCFETAQVDVAVVEVGMGGRLDCTNIIRPDLCLITNISLDHVAFLGNSLEKIAAEKAGIIKPGIPVVIGETTPETRPVFTRKAQLAGAPLCFAEDEHPLLEAEPLPRGGFRYLTRTYGQLYGELGGLYQARNTNTLLCAIDRLRSIGYRFTTEDVQQAFAHVCSLTGLRGRWQKLNDRPLTVCDAGHNIGGIRYIVEQLRNMPCRHLHIVFGMVNDKDITSVLSLLPPDATYYFTQASVPRALPAKQMQELAAHHGLHGQAYPTVKEAYLAAQRQADPQDGIFIGGSCFVVADLLDSFPPPTE